MFWDQTCYEQTDHINGTNYSYIKLILSKKLHFFRRRPIPHLRPCSHCIWLFDWCHWKVMIPCQHLTKLSVRISLSTKWTFWKGKKVWTCLWWIPFRFKVSCFRLKRRSKFLTVIVQSWDRSLNLLTTNCFGTVFVVRWCFHII